MKDWEHVVRRWLPPTFWCAFSLIAAVGCAPAYADSHIRPTVPMVNLTAGYVGVFDNIDRPLRLGAEYRFKAIGKWNLIPAIGFAAAENGASFFYSDVRYDYWLNERWVLIPSFGAGLFDEGDGLDLGSRLEFRSGIEIARRFHGEYRIGVALFHLSNGGTAGENPGTEALVLSLCIPVGQ